jgi:predicted HicB family RNase H-like nuclease
MGKLTSSLGGFASDDIKPQVSKMLQKPDTGARSKKLLVSVDAETHMGFKLMAVRQETTLENVVRSVLEQYIKDQPQ